MYAQCGADPRKKDPGIDEKIRADVGIYAGLHFSGSNDLLLTGDPEY
jgi:hypothetical protein